MPPSNLQADIRVKSIFHPTDLSEASEIAFFHALKLALIAKAEFGMLHVPAESGASWKSFPGVRDTLTRWNILPEGSPEEAVRRLGIKVRKLMAAGSDPLEASLKYLERHPADLIVLAVHQQQGRMGWMDKPVGKPMARAAGEMTLFIPHGVEGFVSRRDGAVSLRNILIPLASIPNPQPAIETAARLIYNLQLPAGIVTLLHAGTPDSTPAVRLPEGTGWTWSRVTRSGAPDQAILQAADELGADLIIMTSEGPDGFLDALRGSTSERVLRTTRCLLLNIPVGSRLG